jgi:hypothetical protein
VPFLFALIPALVVYIVAVTTRSTTAFLVATAMAVAIAFIGAPVFFLFDLAAVVIAFYAVMKTVKFKSKVETAVENAVAPAQWGSRPVQSSDTPRAGTEDVMAEVRRRQANMEAARVKFAKDREAAARRARDDDDFPF